MMTAHTDSAGGVDSAGNWGQIAFSFLSVAEREAIRPFLECREYTAGAVLLEDGTPQDFIGFLESGKLAVKKETAFPGKYILVAILEPGALVGDYATGSEPRLTGTVAVLEPSKLWVLPRERFDQVLEENPALGRKLLVRMIQTFSLRLGKSYDRLAWLL